MQPRFDSKQEQLQCIYDKITTITKSLSEEKRIPAQRSIIDKSDGCFPNTALPFNLNFSNISRNPYDYYDVELAYLLILYNAIARTENDNVVDVQTLYTLPNAITNLYNNNTSKYGVADFLITNEFATEYLTHFSELRKAIAALDVNDPRIAAANAVYAQAAQTYECKWYGSKQKPEILNVLAKTTAFIKTPLNELTAPNNQALAEYTKLANKTHKTGILRTLAVAMLTLAATVMILSAFALPLLGAAMAATAGVGFTVAATILGAASTVGGGLVLASTIGFYSNGNRTRKLGNTMDALAESVVPAPAPKIN